MLITALLISLTIGCHPKSSVKSSDLEGVWFGKIDSTPLAENITEIEAEVKNDMIVLLRLNPHARYVVRIEFHAGILVEAGSWKYDERTHRISLTPSKSNKASDRYAFDPVTKTIRATVYEMQFVFRRSGQAPVDEAVETNRSPVSNQLVVGNWVGKRTFISHPSNPSAKMQFVHQKMDSFMKRDTFELLVNPNGSYVFKTHSLAYDLPHSGTWTLDQKGRFLVLHPECAPEEAIKLSYNSRNKALVIWHNGYSSEFQKQRS